MTSAQKDVASPPHVSNGVVASRLRVLLVPDSIYWVTGTIAKSIAAANPWIEATILSGPVLDQLFSDGESVARRFDLAHFICPYSSRDWLPRLKPLMPVVTSHHHVTSWELIRHNLEGDAIVAGSEEWVEDLLARGADATRVFRVPYGVDTELFGPPAPGQRDSVRRRLGITHAEPVIGFFAKRASNDDDRKGTDVFAEAVSLLHERLPRAGVLIVGPGWQDLVRRFRGDGIPCAWIPFVEEMSGLPPLYHALDFYWVTARVEGGPVTLLEAMSSEVCCLSTSVGLAREVVRDGLNGFLLPMNDPMAFALATENLWIDSPVRRVVGKAARETMLGEMRSEETARMIRDVYARAIVEFSRRKPRGTAPVLPPVEGVWNPGEGAQGALTGAERRRAEMLEALAWSENLILYQNQRAAALRLAMKAWRDYPFSLHPPRVILRRILPGRIVRSVVRLKRVIGGRRTLTPGAAP